MIAQVISFSAAIRVGLDKLSEDSSSNPESSFGAALLSEFAGAGSETFVDPICQVEAVPGDCHPLR
jgi:hypothetical protein|tara:strand:- start:188 stop:385 length:198 start_codon:yes stop_codon:yes gene_type:complete